MIWYNNIAINDSFIYLFEILNPHNYYTNKSLRIDLELIS